MRCIMYDGHQMATYVAGKDGDDGGPGIWRVTFHGAPFV